MKRYNLNSNIVLGILVGVLALCIWQIRRRWLTYQRKRAQHRKRRRRGI